MQNGMNFGYDQKTELVLHICKWVHAAIKILFSAKMTLKFV